MKILKIILSSLLLAVVLLLAFFHFQTKPAKTTEWGITFSRPQAEYLGYDWKTMYLDILNDLQPKHLRLVTYWETLEAEPDLWYFQDVDEMLQEADKRGIDVTLVVGQKVPRWPECHHPYWYNDLSDSKKNAAQLNLVKTAVEHYKVHPSIKTWQVENEALFNFGDDCPTISKDQLAQEIAAVRAIDSRPILMTDSGEVGRWIPTAKLNPDIFGSTMYRVVYHKQFGYIQYPLPPEFFRIKAGILKTFTGKQDVVGVELQAEPWFHDDVFHTDLNQQYALMNPKIFASNIAYAKKAGFKENYFWGVEWWYWMAHANNDWGMWEAAKQALK